jgi:beta-carotene ketolase (CrtW type)
MKKASNFGLLLALVVIGTWVTSTVLLMRWHFSWSNTLAFFFVFVQMHLYTGLIITAHDAMHGRVSSNKFLNNSTGYLATLLYAAFWYPKLYTNHHKHHDHVHTDRDPDYHKGNFVSWYIRFMITYPSGRSSLWPYFLIYSSYGYHRQICSCFGCFLH